MIQRAIISGGGTGGHIFPALAIADELKRRNPNVEILFVGALGKMEMEKVPAAGYKIIGLPISGFQRRFTVQNLSLPFKIVKSLWMASKILNDFKPEVVIGVGGYASGPTLKSAISKGIPTLIQEQNSFPGKTNKLLASQVNRICGAFEELENFFAKEKLVLTGNPVRSEMVNIEGKKQEAIEFFSLDPSKKTLFIMGGSLGARTLNESLLAGVQSLKGNNIQVIWQCGKFYFQEMKEKLASMHAPSVHLYEFVSKMDLAYAAADVIVSRAGAISISELCLIQKPTILVPSPNVAEDHQTKNAMALVDKSAAILVKDSEAREKLIPEVIQLCSDEQRMEALSWSIRHLGVPRATELIVDEIEKIVKK
jgi:UDP-N-acetylglucosamine--N-acetylmuramyl-(pentapeptide) pyrophosphoryl-undecaprenol N-acetylglucosamine transferase